jgi:hypothetical protein
MASFVSLPYLKERLTSFPRLSIVSLSRHGEPLLGLGFDLNPPTSSVGHSPLRGNDSRTQGVAGSGTSLKRCAACTTKFSRGVSTAFRRTFP